MAGSNRPKGRSYMLTVNLTVQERDALRALAKHAACDVTTFVRQWIRRESAEKLGKEITR